MGAGAAKTGLFLIRRGGLGEEELEEEAEEEEVSLEKIEGVSVALFKGVLLAREIEEMQHP